MTLAELVLLKVAAIAIGALAVMQLIGAVIDWVMNDFWGGKQ